MTEAPIFPEEKTTIVIFVSTREALRQRKVISRESYDAVINRLLQETNQKADVTPEPIIKAETTPEVKNG